MGKKGIHRPLLGLSEKEQESVSPGTLPLRELVPFLCPELVAGLWRWGWGGQRRGEFPAWEEIQCPGQGLPPFRPLLNFFAPHAPHPWCLSLWRQQMAGLGGVDEAAGGRGDLSEAPAAFPHLPAPKVQSGITALNVSPAPAANTWGGERTRWGSGGCGRILCPATRQIWARGSLPGPDLLFAPPR